MLHNEKKNCEMEIYTPIAPYEQEYRRFAQTRTAVNIINHDPWYLEI